MLLLMVACGGQGSHADLPDYPITAVDSSVIDDYFGTAVADPFRWLENDTSAAWRSWVTDQRSITDAFLGRLTYRPLLDSRLRQLWSFERYSVPFVRDSFFFIFRNEGLQPRDVLYRTSNPNAGRMTAVLDPAKLGSGLKLVNGTVSPSGDGMRLAFQVEAPVPGWRWILVKDLRRDTILPDTLRGIRFADISWWGEGFFYSRFPGSGSGQPLTQKIGFQQLYYHRLGTAQETDELVFADRTNPDLFFSARTTADERFLLLQFSDPAGGTTLYLRDLQEYDQGFEAVVESFNHRFSVVGNRGRHLLVLTDHQAPRQRLVRVDTRRPAVRYWKEVVPEDEAMIMSDVFQTAGHLFVVYSRAAGQQLLIYDQEGRVVKELELPGPGRVTAVEGGRDRRVYLGFSSLVRPTTVFEISLDDQTMLTHRTPTFGIDADAFQLRQVGLDDNGDGQLSMLLMHRKGIELDGRSPALILVPGEDAGMPGFNISGLLLLPVFLENGGIIALPGRRAGMPKQAAKEGLLAVAEYLIANRYTAADRLAALGIEAGATTVAAAMIERPDIFGAVVLSGGAYDLLRYQQFSTDWIQEADFGSADDPEAFAGLYALSPLHRVRPGSYPPVLIDAGRGSQAMSPVHACKLAAALQSNQQGPHPVLLRMPPPGALTANPATSDRIADGTDLLAFLFSRLRFDPIYEQLK